MFLSAPHRDDNYAELIWTNGGMLTDHNCGIGIGAMDMDSVKDVTGLTAFQTRNSCTVLGGWANGEGCHYGGIIEFHAAGVRQGKVIAVGLAAYSWINNNGGYGWDNMQTITRNALEYLENSPMKIEQVAYAPAEFVSSDGRMEADDDEEFEA